MKVCEIIELINPSTKFCIYGKDGLIANEDNIRSILRLANKDVKSIQHWTLDRIRINILK